MIDIKHLLQKYIKKNVSIESTLIYEESKKFSYLQYKMFLLNLKLI